ncbi:MAG: tRNA pseudouridine(55) synthase TruB [Fimbriimonadaceae bacterium]|nr:tRNA pseudouridine(55) synthase TruB [Fimbriimonadaceae bacterium]
MLGVLIIRKPAGMTSHDVVNLMRRRLGTKRVGHAGTLDPLAEGVLIVAVGSATRFLQYLPLEPKTYRATIRFGEATTTYDAEGDVNFSGPVPDDLAAAIEAARAPFLGLIQQIPPMYSAVKVNGVPLYKMARQGQEIAREPRTVHIRAFDLTVRDARTATAEIVCSGGTYIRSLAHDLGMAMGCGAHLIELVRTGVGRFGLANTVELDLVSEAHLVSLKDALPPMPFLPLLPPQVHAIRQGRQLGLANPPESNLVALLDHHGNVFSVARVMGNMLQPECVIPAEVEDAVA